MLEPSGDGFIDTVRAAVATSPTGRGNYRERAIVMKTWACALQQQGLRVDALLEVDHSLTRLTDTAENPEALGEDEGKVYALIDDAYAVLEDLWQDFEGLSPAKEKTESTSLTGTLNGSVKSREAWPLYHGNPQHTGSTEASGPTEGRVDWRFPVGLGWRSAPVVEGDRVYATSPGLRVALYCFDRHTGEAVWTSRMQPALTAGQLYSTPGASSTPRLTQDAVWVRQMGSRGNKDRGVLEAPKILKFSKADGSLSQKLPACHVDYRAGCAPLEISQDYLVYPAGEHEIEKTPAIATPLNQLACRRSDTGELLWQFQTGTILCDPLVCKGSALVTTDDGVVMALALEGDFPANSDRRIAWQYQCGGAVNSSPTLRDGKLYFGSNDGLLHCLDVESGAVCWTSDTGVGEARSLRLLSTPLVTDNHLYVGAASSEMLCLAADTGQLRWRFETEDWVRAKPVLLGDSLVFADLKGYLYSVSLQTGTEDRLRWKERVSDHPVYADLAGAGQNVYLSSADLRLHCFDASGDRLWQRDLIESFYEGDTRIQTDQLAGGAFYQSKATADNGLVYIGAPSGFVHAVDAATGEERWKFEGSGAVSAAPACNKGKLFFGQQGGDDTFYCLDALSGQPRWTQALGWVWGSANLNGGRVFVPGIDGFANCLDADTGAILWRYRTGRSTCTEPVLYEDLVIFGSWDRYLYALNVVTGKLAWKQHIGNRSDSGAQVIHQNRMYLGNHTDTSQPGDVKGDGWVRCIDLETGDILWETSKKRTGFNATPALRGKHLLISTSRGRGLGGVALSTSVHCFDAHTGEFLWEHPGGGLTGPVIAGDHGLIASTASPYTYCFRLDNEDNEDGEASRTLWTLHLGNKVEEATPALYGGRAFLLCCDGYLYAVR